MAFRDGESYSVHGKEAFISTDPVDHDGDALFSIPLKRS
jgi:hypothetical protein